MKDTAASIRKKIFLTAYGAGIGHLASAYSIVEIMYALYCNGVLNVDPKNPGWEGRDRFILSKGHGSLALYTILARVGFIAEKDLATFNRPGSRLGGEPHPLETPGIEAATGALGHGLSIGVGMALAFKCDQKKNQTYVVIGDGESQEGSIWEAAMSAAAFKLSNLCVILDCNRLQKMGAVEDIIGDPRWRSKWESFGWQVTEVDGHDIDAVTNCLRQESRDRPRCIIAHTIKGKGASVMENNPGFHYRLPNKKELKVFMRELDITEQELASCKRVI